MSVTITGNINDLTGTAITSNCYVRFWLRGCNGNQPRVGGAALIAPDNGPTYWQDFAPNGSGQISGTLYSNDVNISAGGQVGVTWYDVQVFLNGQGGSYTPYALADGTTFNLNSATPITTNPVAAAPTGDSTYARLDGGNISSAANPFLWSTPIKFKTLNNIRFADQFTGADWAAKINAADTDLGTTDGTIYVPSSLAGAASTALALSAGRKVIFDAGTFTSSAQIVLSADKIRIIGAGQGQTILQYTGSAVASFIKLGTATPTTSQLFSMALEEMTIKGSANVTDTVFITGVHHSLFRNLDLKDCTQAGFHSKFAVCLKLENVRCSLNSGAFAQQPANGILLGSIDSSHLSTAGTVITPIVEGVSGSGIKLDGAEGFVLTAGTSEQNNRGIEITTASFRNTVIGLDMEGNTTEDILDNGQNNTYLGCYSLNLAHVGASSVNAAIKYGDYNSVQVDSGAIKAKIEDIYYNGALTGTITDSAQETTWENIVNASTNLQTPVPVAATGWFFRDVIPQATSAGVGGVNRQDMLRGTFDIPTGGKTLSTTACGTTPWRVLFIGAWMNNFDGGGLTMPPLITEVTTAAPTLNIGSLTLTASKNASNQLVLTSSGSIITFTGTIFVTTMAVGVAGTLSAAFKGSVAASGLPQVIASGTSTLTANATLASVTNQTAITTGATGAATTDAIEWAYASAPGAGDSLCHVSAYVTSGNVNFVRSNPTAASQNVSALVINWRVIR